MIVIGLICMFYFGVVLWRSPCCASMDPRCSMLQYIHDSLMVGGVSDRSTDPSKWVVAYEIKVDFILNAMVRFYLNDL